MRPPKARILAYYLFPKKHDDHVLELSHARKYVALCLGDLLTISCYVMQPKNLTRGTTVTGSSHVAKAASTGRKRFVPENQHPVIFLPLQRSQFLRQWQLQSSQSGKAHVLQNQYIIICLMRCNTKHVISGWMGGCAVATRRAGMQSYPNSAT